MSLEKILTPDGEPRGFYPSVVEFNKKWGAVAKKLEKLSLDEARRPTLGLLPENSAGMKIPLFNCYDVKNSSRLTPEEIKVIEESKDFKVVEVINGKQLIQDNGFSLPERIKLAVGKEGIETEFELVGWRGNNFLTRGQQVVFPEKDIALRAKDILQEKLPDFIITKSDATEGSLIITPKTVDHLIYDFLRRFGEFNGDRDLSVSSPNRESSIDNDYEIWEFQGKIFTVRVKEILISSSNREYREGVESSDGYGLRGETGGSLSVNETVKVYASDFLNKEKAQDKVSANKDKQWMYEQIDLESIVNTDDREILRKQNHEEYKEKAEELWTACYSLKNEVKNIAKDNRDDFDCYSFSISSGIDNSLRRLSSTVETSSDNAVKELKDIYQELEECKKTIELVINQRKETQNIVDGAFRSSLIKGINFGQNPYMLLEEDLFQSFNLGSLKRDDGFYIAAEVKDANKSVVGKVLLDDYEEAIFYKDYITSPVAEPFSVINYLEK